MEKTCHTFDNEKESAAFMLGYMLGQCKKIFARIDDEETQTVLIDCNGDKADGVYFQAIADFQELRVSLGIGRPEEQYAHDCLLPNGE
jgi:hypothetical protein